MMRTWGIGVITAGLLAAGAVFPAGCRRPDAAQIRVDTRPEGAALTCDGVMQDRSPTTVTGLTPGTHLLVASMPGYRDARQSVSLMAGQRAAVTLELEPIEGLALIHSDPMGAEVSIDGAFRGRTPLMLPDIPLGRHRVELQAAGYLPRTVDLRVEDRVPRKLDVELVSNAAELFVRSEPPDAEVRIDGSPKGPTPCRIGGVPAGSVRLTVFLEGFEPFEQSLDLSAGDTRELDVRLTPVPGSLRVVSLPSGGRVYVDDRFRGQTPLLLDDLEPGRYRVRVERQGFAPLARDVTVAATRSEVEEFRLERTSGTLVLVTEPAGVQVYIDGQLRGTTAASQAGAVSEPLKIDYLSEGEHVLQLSRQGYRYPSRKIRVEARQMINLHEKLQRRFIPDTRVLLVDGREQRGVLAAEHPDGTIELEVRPGVVVEISRDRIARREPIR